MRRLPPVILLVVAILGPIAYQRIGQRASRTPATSTSVRPLAIVAASSPPAAAPLGSFAPPASTQDPITRALRSGSTTERDIALQQLLPRLVAQDPAAAGHLALDWEAGPLRDEFLRQVIRLWAEADLGSALAWLVSLPDPADRQLAAAAVIAQVAQSDRAGALDLALLLRIGLDDGSLEHAVQLWTEDEPHAAVNWVMTQPEGPIRNRLLARIAWISK